MTYPSCHCGRVSVPAGCRRRYPIKTRSGQRVAGAWCVHTLGACVEIRKGQTKPRSKR